MFIGKKNIQKYWNIQLFEYETKHWLNISHPTIIIVVLVIIIILERWSLGAPLSNMCFCGMSKFFEKIKLEKLSCYN